MYTRHVSVCIEYTGGFCPCKGVFFGAKFTDLTLISVVYTIYIIVNIFPRVTYVVRYTYVLFGTFASNQPPMSNPVK